MDNNLVAFTYGREEKIKGRPYLLPVRYLSSAFGRASTHWICGWLSVVAGR